jgi:hypothetical protein
MNHHDNKEDGVFKLIFWSVVFMATMLYISYFWSS